MCKQADGVGLQGFQVPEIRFIWRHGDLQDLTRHIQLRKCFTEPLWLQNNFINDIGAAEIKIQSLLRLLSIDFTHCHHASFFQKQHQRVTITLVTHPKCSKSPCNGNKSYSGLSFRALRSASPQMMPKTQEYFTVSISSIYVCISLWKGTTSSLI